MMIKVSDYYNQGNTIFENNSNLQTLIRDFPDKLSFLSDLDLVMLDVLFMDNYSDCMLSSDNETKNQLITSANIWKNKELYKGIYDALNIEIDVLEPTDVTETLESGKEGSNTKTGKEQTDITKSETTTPNLTTLNTKNLQDQTTLNTTRTNTPANIVENQNRTFDNDTLTTVQKEINSGTITDRDTGTNTVAQTGTDTVTQTGTNSVSGTEGNTKEYNNVKDDFEETLEEERRRHGHDNIDFEKAVAALYNTRTVNLYDRILSDIYAEIVIPLYFY